MRSSEQTFAFPVLSAAQVARDRSATGDASLSPEPSAAIAAALAEADEIRRRAYEEGFAAGLAEGRADAAALDSAVAALERAASEAAVAFERRVERLEREAVDLALGLAEKVVAGALEVQPERVLDAITGALRALVERERVQVLVNPDDLELVRDRIDGVAARLGGIAELDVQAERRVERGGAVVRTSAGDVEATASAKLARARELVARELAT